MSAADIITPAVIDYSIAAEFADAVQAFAIIESRENPWARGDRDEAFGLLQMHPATFKRYYGCQTRFAPSVDDTWTQAQIKACAAFLLAHKWFTTSQSMRDLIVQAWNLGEAAVFIQGRRNPEYLSRWLNAWEKIAPPKQ